MTTNIWGDYFGNPVEARERNMYRVYETYAPDVIGFQEVTASWYKSDMFRQLSEAYSFVGTEIFDSSNFVPLAVKRDYDILSKGYEHCAETPDGTKGITWAVIGDRDTQKLCGVCNVHFWWMTGREEHDRLREKNAQQLCDIMRYLHERFDCPVFAFGDMNCARSGGVFNNVYRMNGANPLFDMAGERDDVCSHHGDPAVDGEGNYHGKKSAEDQGRSIDHIVAMGDGFSVLQYRVVEDQYALDATDHSPVFADVVL